MNNTSTRAHNRCSLFLQGARAVMNGEDIDDSPYEFGSLEHDHWLKGWNAADIALSPSLDDLLREMHADSEL